MRRKNVVLLGVAAGLFGIAGYFIYGNLHEFAGEKAREAARWRGRRT